MFVVIVSPIREGSGMMELPRRKRNRLKNYDYSSPGVYFITICTRNMAELFWDNVDIPAAEITDVGAASGRPQHYTNLPQSHCLSAYGQIVDVAIQNIRRFYPAVSVNKYVIMPNHVHLLLQIHSDDFGRPLAAPTISTVIQNRSGFRCGRSCFTTISSARRGITT